MHYILSMTELASGVWFFERLEELLIRGYESVEILGYFAYKCQNIPFFSFLLLLNEYSLNNQLRVPSDPKSIKNLLSEVK